MALLLSVSLPVICIGCGGGSSGSEAATSSASSAGSRAIEFKSPSINNATIPVRYTCDGANITPSFQWGSVPPNTYELILFLFKVTHAASTGSAGSKSVQALIEWGIAGLSPHIHAIPAGKLPPGVTTSGHYSICPAKGKSETYVFQLNALSHQITVSPNFNPQTLFQEVEGSTLAVGNITFNYQRT